MGFYNKLLEINNTLSVFTQYTSTDIHVSIRRGLEVAAMGVLEGRHIRPHFKL